MRFLLDLAYVTLGLIASPYILIRMAASRRWRAGFRQRLGFVPLRAGDRRCVWIHAVSVGEVNTVRPLVSAIERECLNWDVRVSTTTNTGQATARSQYGAERCFYFPLDLSWVVRRVFRRVRPDAIVLMELELWPNLLRLARDRAVPVVVVNGRMREERVGRYRSARFLFRPALDPATHNAFCVQNETYRDRFERAGIPAQMIHVTGNMKYDAVHTEVEPAQLDELRAALGIAAEERVWVAGCTWPGEEAICLRAHRRLLEHDPALRLIIAPRHVERSAEVAREITHAGYRCRRRSDPNGPTGPETVVLLDTVGELGYVYALGEFAFVGKSLTARGGHNVLEPAALGVTPVFGPLTDSFEEEVRLLLEAGAAERVMDESEFCQATLRLLKDAALRRRRAHCAREALLTQQGATDRHMQILRRLLHETDGS